MLAFDRVLAHPVRQLVNMPANLQHKLGCDDSAIQFQHVLLKNEVLPPHVHDIGLQGASWGGIVKEPTVVTFEVWRQPVDLKCLSEEEATLEDGLEKLLVKLLACEGGCCRSHHCLIWAERELGNKEGNKGSQNSGPVLRLINALCYI